MKILHVIHGYPPALGGSERLMQGISENLHHRYQDEISIFTTTAYSAQAFVDPSFPVMPAGQSTVNGLPVHRFQPFNRLAPVLFHLQRWAYHFSLPGNQYLRAWFAGPILPGLKQAIIKFEADVVAAASFPLLQMFTTLKACQASGKPLVYMGALHPLDDFSYNRPMIYQAIHQAQAYIALSDYEKQFLVKNWQVPADKISVLGVGIDVAPFQQATGETVRTRYGLGDRPVVAFIGQQGVNKGIDNLILAMKLVWAEMPTARLLIAGAMTVSTPRFQALIQTRLTPAEQARIVYLHNFTEAEKPELFAACDVFAYPSKYESFGIAFIEAWAAGKPVIGCRAGAVPSVVTDGLDGLLVPVDDPLSLSVALLRLLESPRLRQKLGQAGHRKVLQRYTWQKISQKWRAVYERVADPTSASTAL